METQTERLVQSNEGTSEATTESEVTIHELAEVATGRAFVATATAATEAVQPEPIPSVSPDTAPTGYEGVPPELWPGPDGNPPQLTERLLSKLRAKYFTVRHPLLTECGHKLDMINQPKNNCENCWFQFFNTHPQLVEVADQFYRTHGKKPMIGMRGVKFVKNFGRYMVTVAHFMKQEGRLSEPNDIEGQANGITSEGETGEGISGSADQGRETKISGLGSGLSQQTVCVSSSRPETRKGEGGGTHSLYPYKSGHGG